MQADAIAAQLASGGALAIAAAIRSGEVSAVEVARAALDAIAARNGLLNCFTAVTAERALAEAAAVDAKRARGETLPALAGVPYAAKNLFDISHLTTLAGSRIQATQPPATRDAALVERLHAAGAVLVGATNMDEYAYGFTTENTHYGVTRNPRDTNRIAGGSSGGSAAAVAAGLAPLALGTDTNGSIRVPASLCGIYGIKPTYGRLSRRGAFPFVASFDHVGPFARSVADLAACYDALQDADPDDPVQARRAPEPTVPSLDEGARGLRVAVLGGYFERVANDQARAARDTVARALGATRSVELPEVERARAAAFVITGAEGAALHLQHLRTRSAEFDPIQRERFLAGALLPAVWAVQAQRLRAWFRARVLELLRDHDILLTPATPFAAPAFGEDMTEVGGVRMPTRPAIGLQTQPISFVGLPVVTVPVWPGEPGRGLPMGVQVIAAPWREDLALRVAAQLERDGVVSSPVAA